MCSLVSDKEAKQVREWMKEKKYENIENKRGKKNNKGMSDNLRRKNTHTHVFPIRLHTSNQTN